MKRFALTAVACGVMQVASAQVAITDIVPSSNAEGTELRVTFNGAPVQPKAYQLDNPSRLVLDFEGVQNNTASANVVVNSNEATTALVQADSERSRVTVNLDKFGSFSTRNEGNTFVLKIASPNAPVAPVVEDTPPQTTAKSTAAGLRNVDFQRGSQGEGLVTLTLSDAAVPVDVKQQGSKVVVRMLGAKVPANLARRLNVNDFATPVSTIDAYNEGSNGVIVIQPSGSYEYMAYQAQDKLTISVKRPEATQTARSTAKRYTGKKISLDFQDIEVRRVLQLLADFTDTNIVASDSVNGQITIRLKDVPWDQALDIILQAKGLDKRTNGRVTWVAPLAELIKAEEDAAKLQAQSIKAAPLQTDYIQLKYAKAADILALVNKKTASTDKDGENTGNLLSSRGTASLDARTNTLIINDTAKNIDDIRKMVDVLDVPIKQVMIEARVVRASNEFSKEFGVKWGLAGQKEESGNRWAVSGTSSSLWNDISGGTSTTSGTTGTAGSSTAVIDLGAATRTSQIAFGLLNVSDFMLDLELSASQADGLTEIVSTPKVLTMDKQQATIKSGYQIPYQTKSSTGGAITSDTEFKDAVLLLDVTPSITPDGKVSMQLNITKDSLAGYAQNGEALIATNQVQTYVVANNGETVVLGGVFESEQGNTVNKVPLLGDLPIIGHLFRNTIKTDKRNELLIFITPRIVNDNSLINR